MLWFCALFLMIYFNMATQEFPFEIKNVSEEEDKIIKQYYKDYTRPFIRVGPEGYLMMAGYGDHAADIYNLDVRADDIWVTTFSRSGTTWLQELVWLVANGLDFDKARSVSLTERFAYLEHPTQKSEIRAPTSAPHGTHHGGRATAEDFRTFPKLKSPRFAKSHLPLSLLPPTLLDTAKVFYIARDPRDVAVSFHFAHKLFRYFDEGVTMEQFWDLFKKDLIMHAPIFLHINEAWQKRNHPNLMFLFYEEMQNDLRDVIDRVCKFLGREYSDEEKKKLAEYLDFNNMKKKPIAPSSGKGEENTFFRKGKSGNWVHYFNDKMKEEAEEFMAKNINKTGIRFPDIKN